jgi:ketosteroid isomerase-like protein
VVKRTYGLVVTFVLIIASGALALGQTPKKTGGEDVADTIKVLDHIWLDASHNRDTGTLDWLFAKDFIEIHPGGLLANKQEQIDQIRDPKIESLNIHPEDINVRYVSPDVAVLTDTTIIQGLSGGVNYNGKYRVMRVFVKQGGRWRAAGAGIAPLTAQQ